MASISTKRGHQISVALGNGAVPEVYTVSALINTTRGLTLTTNLNAAEVCDAADQSKPAATQRFAQSTDSKIDGSGQMHSTDVKTWMDWWALGTSKSIKITGMGATLTGPYFLSSFSVTAEREGVAEVSVTLEQGDTPAVTAQS